MLGLIVMTALPPTEGHLGLLRFASAHARSLDGTVLALMCVLPDEPPGRAEHRDALWEALLPEERCGVRLEIQFSNDPQGPSGPDDDAFWSHWVARVLRHTAGRNPTHVYSSEVYGPRLAASLGAEHVPYDGERIISQVRATSVRENLVHDFPRLVRPLRDRLRRRVVFFGSESTGKTTLARQVALSTESVWCPEWARPYLEGLPTPEVTSDRMDAIAVGQAAQERAAAAAAAERGCPFLFLDTDLLSTIGYDEYYASTRRYARDDQWRRRRDLMEKLFVPADLYLVPEANILMTPDPLRYAGDARETTTIFWVRMLMDRGLNWRIVKADGRNERWDEAKRAAKKCLSDRAGFVDYERRR